MKTKNITTSILLTVFSFTLFISCNNSDLEGNYLNQNRGFYKSIDFKGKTSVVVTDGIIGLPYATSYERDGKIIRIRTDKSDLMLTIKDSKTLIGEGYAEGTYIKSE